MTVHGVHRTGGSGLVPRSTPGRWSVGLFVVFVAAIVVFFVIAIAGSNTWGPEWTSNAEATIPLLIAAAAAVGSLVVGVVAIVKSDDRSMLVTTATIVAGMVTVYFIGELLSVIGVLPQH